MEDLFGQVIERLDLCDRRVKDMRLAGVQHAEMKARYRVAVAAATLDERAKGTPATLIRDLVRGREDISGLKVAMDCAEVNAKAFQEEINVGKLRARVLNDQLSREWGQAGREW